MSKTYLLRAALALCLTAASSVYADTWQPREAWRIDSARLAPWAPSGTRVNPAYRGGEIRFQSARVVAPRPLACEGAKYQWIFVGAEDLFEGNLPAPAASAAQRLGIAGAPVATLRVTCTNGGFDFHRSASGDLLLGLDNVVWTLRAARAASTPAEIVQELLITHFTHDMAFTSESLARKNAYLSAGLRTRIADYLAVPQADDAVPDINGDPFTDSQEYPDRFTLGAVRVSANKTVVPVHFSDANTKRRVDYVLVNDAKRWVVDDLVDERGRSLRDLLGASDGKRTGTASDVAPAARSTATAESETFEAFLIRFRAALKSGRAADVATFLRVPFLYEGRQLDAAGVVTIVPGLFTPTVKRCLANVKTIAEEDRRVAFCRPYAFYFGRENGAYTLLEFAADGESTP